MSAPVRLCTPWCVDHDDAGRHDQWCQTQCRLDLANWNGESILVEVSRHAGRSTADADWREDQGLIYLDGKRLRPHEALQLAQRLLAAHALATGTAADW